MLKWVTGAGFSLPWCAKKKCKNKSKGKKGSWGKENKGRKDFTWRISWQIRRNTREFLRICQHFSFAVSMSASSLSLSWDLFSPKCHLGSAEMQWILYCSPRSWCRQDQTCSCMVNVLVFTAVVSLLTNITFPEVIRQTNQCTPDLSQSFICLPISTTTVTFCCWAI